MFQHISSSYSISFQDELKSGQNINIEQGIINNNLREKRRFFLKNQYIYVLYLEQQNLKSIPIISYLTHLGSIIQNS